MYPRIDKLGVPVHHNERYDAVDCEELDDALKKKGDKYLARFGELFGVQTAPVLDNGKMGLYASDVEAVLERMESGKLTGSQLDWD
jgi:hypothetical protein